MRSGAILAFDANRQRIEALCTGTGIYETRKRASAILAAARAVPGIVLEEQRWGRFWPLTEATLARFEGRDPVGARDRAVGL